jgi:hypothetical protein
MTQTRRAEANETATAESIASATAASPTPTVGEILARCDLNYVIIEPLDVRIAPSLRDERNSRLVRARTDFTFNLVLENASTCDWPASSGLEFFFLQDTTALEVDYGPLAENCADRDRIFHDQNFTSPERPRMFVEQAVKRGEQITLTISGRAPERIGCYFGMWRLQFANYDNLPVGEPIALSIQVYGGN